MRREKISTDVHFPIEGLDLSAYVSPDLSPSSANRKHAPVYDLFAVSNHHGSLNSGHYIAHVDVKDRSNAGSVGGRDSESGRSGSSNSNSSGGRWLCFNDARVSNANSANAVGPTAYVLFYQLRESGNTSSSNS